MGKTSALIDHLNATQEEREGFTMQTAGGPVSGIDYWAHVIPEMMTEALAEFEGDESKSARFVAAVENSLAPEMAAAVNEIFTELVEEDGADFAEKAERLAAMLRERGQSGELFAHPEEEDARINKVPGQGSPTEIIEKLQKEDPDLQLMGLLMVLRVNDQAANGIGAPTSDEPADQEPIPAVAHTPHGQKMMGYLKDAITDINLSANERAVAAEGSEGMPFRTLDAAGLPDNMTRGLRNDNPNFETLVGGATPQEMAQGLRNQIVEDIQNGQFPFAVELEGDTPEERHESALEFADKFIGALGGANFFAEQARVIQATSLETQTVGFWPSDAGFGEAVNTFFSLDEMDAEAPDLNFLVADNIDAETFEDVLASISPIGDVDFMVESLQEAFRDQIMDGNLSIYGRDDPEQSLAVLDEVIAKVGTQMREGTVSGGSFIGGDSWTNDKQWWDENQFARLMREGMAEAGLHYEYGVGPRSVESQMSVYDAPKPDIVDLGVAVDAKISETELDATDPESGDVLFSFSEEFAIYRVTGDADTGVMLDMIDDTDNERPLGHVTPRELRALLGDGEFTIAQATMKPMEEGMEGDPLGFRIETADGNAFYIMPDAFEPGSITEVFKQQSQQPQEPDPQTRADLSMPAAALTNG